MGAVPVQPEHRLAALQALAVDGQAHPVLDRGLAGRAQAPDVARIDRVAVQLVAVGGGDGHGAGMRDLERGRVRAVFLGLLGHQADVLDGARGARVQRAGFLEISDALVIDVGIGRVGDHAVGIRLGPVGAPALAAGAQQRRDRRVDDHVGRHVQVRDALVRVHHVQRRALRHDRVDLGADRIALGHLRHAGQHGAQAAIGVRTRRGQRRAVTFEHRRQPGAHDMAEDDRVRDLHHRGLQVDREQRAFGLRRLDLGLQKAGQLGHGQEAGIDHGARGQVGAVLQHGHLAVSAGQLDTHAPGLFGRQRHRRLVAAEIARGHRRHAGLAVGGPLAHRMGMRLGIVLDRPRGAAVRIALAQDGVHGRSLQRVVPGADLGLGVVLRIDRIVGQVIALRLQLLDRAHQLRHRGRDVGQLDDVGGGRLDPCAQARQIVRLRLFRGQPFGKRRDDAPRQRDVARRDGDSGRIRKAADDRQQRCRRQLGRLVHLGIDDLGCVVFGHGLLILVLMRGIVRRVGGKCPPSDPLFRGDRGALGVDQLFLDRP